MTRTATNASIVVTGGCGFVGSNLADSLLGSGESVTIIDNLARPGVEQNLAWLRDKHGRRLVVRIADIRDRNALSRAIGNAKAIFHLAAQTAVTTSLVDPTDDFEINARGTLNLLESVRATGRDIPVIFASTNKVYGALSEMAISTIDGSDLPADETLRRHGVNEDQPLDFSTPYGCSKGVADQYVLDYAKSYGISTAVLRMSCIYGPRQFGTEDQGWIAHFLIRALSGKAITIFGDGNQVRDVLHVSDAVAAYRLLLQGIDRHRGKAFNLGGGVSNAVSLNVVLGEISRILGRKVEVRHAEARIGDQRYFVADTRRIQTALEWQAKLGWRQGLEDLAAWLGKHRTTALTHEEVGTSASRPYRLEPTCSSV
ncbi:CDP-paratose 2-epimerase [Labrys okinawensis]|uniref:CDP-paratose 2-epimerase n=1 Tax=Labrys okinawensis TaxID=346911 RepID=A0A2S9QIC4_9HYPH|nr:NAD-dependent epimerase/dehydratase family protein [Labrys okinawensis]PRH89085.1 CDP-paratose 2-epimerase [Labrys okinawensis]